MGGRRFNFYSTDACAIAGKILMAYLGYEGRGSLVGRWQVEVGMEGAGWVLR